jgi:EAL domain-containing protein (putative c-di-GMP-specific phosphodiesterase class I)
MPIDIDVVRRALNNDEIVPCFQPIVNMHSGLLTGFEVLARWRHTNVGFILPENFISLTEEHGLAEQLMRQVLRKAFQAASSLPEKLGLSVNVSPKQVRDLRLPRQIRDAAEEVGFPVERLTVELTENALVDNLERAQENARELKRMRCRLALDDFGTGCSSLQHLQIFPFDELKIDCSFIDSMTFDEKSRKIVAAIVGLGRNLGLTVSAEGVERSEQAEILLRLGCERGQGWLYGWPVPAADLRRVIDDAQDKFSMLVLKCDAAAFLSLEAEPKQNVAAWKTIYDNSSAKKAGLTASPRGVSSLH